MWVSPHTSGCRASLCQPETAWGTAQVGLLCINWGLLGMGPNSGPKTPATIQADPRAGCGPCLQETSLLFAAAVLPSQLLFTLNKLLSLPCGSTYHPSMATRGYSSLKYVHLSKDLATKKHVRVFFGHDSKTIPKA